MDMPRGEGTMMMMVTTMGNCKDLPSSEERREGCLA